MYIWRNEAHEFWAGETLYFWKISIAQSRDLTDFSQAIISIFRNENCYSYRVYYVTGSSDIVIRSWLKSPHNKNRISDHIKTAFRDCEVVAIEVEEICAHWIWDEHYTSDFETKLLPIGREIVDSINNGTVKESDKEKLRDYATEFPVDQEGTISFFVFCPVRGGMGLKRSGKIKRVFEEIARSTNVQDLSLYISSNSASHHDVILKGTIDGGHFTNNFSLFIHKLVEADQVIEANKFHSESCIILKPIDEEKYFVDELVIQDQGDGSNAYLDYLNLEESQYLECKASLSTNIERAMHKHELVKTDITEESVLKTIVGFLNTPDNGVLIIGVLETELKSHQDLADKLGLETQGLYYVMGLNDFDYKVVGNSSKESWDGFTLYFQDLIESRVTPSRAANYVNIEKVTIKGKDICIAKVDSPESGRFFLKKHGSTEEIYYRRQGARTIKVPSSEVFNH